MHSFASFAPFAVQIIVKIFPDAESLAPTTDRFRYYLRVRYGECDAQLRRALAQGARGKAIDHAAYLKR